MSVGLLAVSEEEGFDERTMLEFELLAHFFHVKDRLMFVKFIVDGEVLEVAETLLPGCDSCFLHN